MTLLKRRKITTNNIHNKIKTSVTEAELLANKIRFSDSEKRELAISVAIRKKALCIDCGQNPHFSAMRIRKDKTIICANCDAIRWYRETIEPKENNIYASIET